MYRIVMLVRDGIDVKILNEYSDSSVAGIWVKLGARGRKPMVIGGIYREHRFIHHLNDNDSGSVENQTIEMELICL